MDILFLALFTGVVGILLLLLGLGLGKLCHTTRKIHERGLDRDLHLNFIQQMTVFERNPGISIPVTLAFFGVVAIMFAIVIAIVSLIQQLAA